MIVSHFYRATARGAAVIFSLALTCAFPPSARAQALPDSGAWTIQGAERSQVNFQIRIDSSGSNVSFRVVRDAGTLQCSGHVAGGEGGGTFRYAPNPNFPNELAARGVARPSPDQQQRMAYSDVTLAFVDTPRRNGYNVTSPTNSFGWRTTAFPLHPSAP